MFLSPACAVFSILDYDNEMLPNSFHLDFYPYRFAFRLPGSDSRGFYWRPKYVLCFSEPHYLIKRDFFLSYLWSQLHRREGDHCIITSSPNIRNVTYRSSIEIPTILEVAHILPRSLNKFNDGNGENKVDLECIT